MENQSLNVEVVIAAYQREVAALHARAIVAEVAVQQALSEAAALRQALETQATTPEPAVDFADAIAAAETAEARL